MALVFQLMVGVITIAIAGFALTFIYKIVVETIQNRGGGVDNRKLKEQQKMLNQYVLLLRDIDSTTFLTSDQTEEIRELENKVFNL